MIPRETQIVHVVMSAQLLSNYIVDMKANNWFTKTLLNFVNNFIKKLHEVERNYFDIYFNHKEEDSAKLYNSYDKFTHKAATVPLWDMDDISTLIDAYYADPKSMQGIAKKVLKQK